MKLSRESEELTKLQYVRTAQEITHQHYQAVRQFERTMPRGGGMKAAIDREYIQMAKDLVQAKVNVYIEAFRRENVIPDENDIAEIYSKLEEIVSGIHRNNQHIPLLSSQESYRSIAPCARMELVIAAKKMRIEQRRSETLNPVIFEIAESYNDMSTVLFLTADPTNESRLRLGEEFREIQEKLQLAKLRDRFVLHHRTSIRPADFSQSLLDLGPDIVHFSGHGQSTGELCFEDNTGKALPISPDALAGVFEHFSPQVKCVVLNACYSESQARAIAEHIEYVVGMDKAIGDRAAIAFAVGFYQALGAGRSIEEAFKLGCAQIGLQGISESSTPVLVNTKNQLAKRENLQPRQPEGQINAQTNKSDDFTLIGMMNKPRHHHMTAVLPSGDILIVGGYDYTSKEVLSSAEIFQTSTQASHLNGRMSARRYFSAAALLADSSLLVLGGTGEQGETLDTVELYNHRTSAFSIIGRMTTPRRGHIAIRLNNGKILIAGGKDHQGATLASAEIYDPIEDGFSETGPMSAARLTEHTPNAVLLSNGLVMIAGGYDGIRGEIASVEIYDPRKNAFMKCANMAIGRACHTLTLLPNGKVLIVGGYNEVGGHLTSAELYDPIANETLLLPETKASHFHHTATLSKSGKVLVVGGASNLAELFDPDTNTFSDFGVLKEGRYLHTSVLLRDGRVAIIGGANGSNSLASVEMSRSF